MPTFEREAYEAALAEAPRLPGEAGVEERMRELSYLNLTRFLPYLLDRKDRMSMAQGLEVRVPFCDHRLVEYAFNIPWAMKTFDGHEKSILRAAFADILPSSIAERRKSPYPATSDPGYERLLRERVSRIVDDEEDPTRDLLDPGALDGLLKRPLRGHEFRERPCRARSGQRTELLAARHASVDRVISSADVDTSSVVHEAPVCSDPARHQCRSAEA